MRGDAELPVGFSVFNVQTNRRIYKEFIDQHERDQAYIAELERLLKELHVEIPEKAIQAKRVVRQVSNSADTSLLMKDGSMAALAKSIERIKGHTHTYEINVQYKNLSFWNALPEKTIPTVGSTLRSMVFGSGPTKRVDIFKDLSGRILPQKMTLLMGPPGCGASLCYCNLSFSVLLSQWSSNPCNIQYTSLVQENQRF